MIIVRDFSKKKVSDYLKDGIKALLYFPHGLGDDVMFMPLLLRLRELYPQSEIDVQWADGRDLFPQPKELTYYDYVFYIIFHETPTDSRYIKYSKPECCCVEELGIQWDESLDFTWKPETIESPFIGVSFMCNSNPNYNIPYSVAKQVWQAIQYCGKVPIEIYFMHQQYNPKNKPYDFITCTTRGVTPSVKTFTATLQACKAFIGVNTGALCMAAAMYPERVLHLQNKFPFTFYRKRKVEYIIADGLSYFDPAPVIEWIRRVCN